MRGLPGLHRKNVLIMTFFFIPVFWFGYANEKKVAVSRWKIMCAYCMNIELILSKWCLDHLLIKVGRTFGGVIVLNVCHLDRLSHDHWTENVAALYIDPNFFFYSMGMPGQWSSSLLAVFLQVQAWRSTLKFQFN